MSWWIEVQIGSICWDEKSLLNHRFFTILLEERDVGRQRPDWGWQLNWVHSTLLISKPINDFIRNEAEIEGIIPYTYDVNYEITSSPFYLYAHFFFPSGIQSITPPVVSSRKMENPSKRATFPTPVIAIPSPPLISCSTSSSSSSPPHLSLSPTINATGSDPPPQRPPSAPLQLVVLSPCAACKILRRRCVDNCILAPYFPPTEPLKFTTAHRVFGASNIIKFLQVYTEPFPDLKFDS